MNIVTYLQIASTVFATIAGGTLFYASVEVPHNEVSYKGQTPKEISHRKRQSILKWIGIPSLGFGAALQILSLCI